MSLPLRLGPGNEAVIDGALAAGCMLLAGYPITPATEILEVAADKFVKHGRIVVPAESEIAAIHMVAGASLAGHRAMTATSGIGLSLMSEALSFFSGLSELPGVVVVQQRWGPGDGSLGPGQDTYRQATRAAGHGDFRMIVLAPASVQETADLVQLAFELADKYRLFVLVLGDQISALTTETYRVSPPAGGWATRERFRGQVAKDSARIGGGGFQGRGLRCHRAPGPAMGRQIPNDRRDGAAPSGHRPGRENRRPHRGVRIAGSGCERRPPAIE